MVDHTRALLKSKLPPELLANLLLDTLEHTKETFLSSSDHEKRLDLLYSARFVDGTEVLIYFLLEHKSDIDRHIALQLLEYVLKIHDWRRRSNLPILSPKLRNWKLGFALYRLSDGRNSDLTPS